MIRAAATIRGARGDATCDVDAAVRQVIEARHADEVIDLFAAAGLDEATGHVSDEFCTGRDIEQRIHAERCALLTDQIHITGANIVQSKVPRGSGRDASVHEQGDHHRGLIRAIDLASS